MIKEIKNKKVLIFGLGILGGGREAVRWFYKNGAKIVITDKKTKKDLLQSIKKLKKIKAKYVLGKHRFEDIDSSDIVYFNPGVSYKSQWAQYAKKKDKEVVAPTPTPLVAPSEVTPTGEISPSPTPKISRADLKIKVLNGTGVPGAAGKVAELLEKFGWQGIKTGNADNFDYQKTVIQIKESKKEYFELLKKDLSSKYTLEEEPQTLSEDENFDAVIIVGKD